MSDENCDDENHDNKNHDIDEYDTDKIQAWRIFFQSIGDDEKISIYHNLRGVNKKLTIIARERINKLMGNSVIIEKLADIVIYKFYHVFPSRYWFISATWINLNKEFKALNMISKEFSQNIGEKQQVLQMLLRYQNSGSAVLRYST